MASLNELREERLKKLERLKSEGVSVYPVMAELDLSLAETLAKFADLETAGADLVVGGRVVGKRGQGGLFFVDLFDGTGKLQAVLKRDEMAAADFNLFEETVDLGDFIAVAGTLLTTKRGEKSIAAKSWRMLAKSLRPLPEKWHGLQDTEERFRRRYLDTLMNEEVRERFVARSKIVSGIRRFLDQAGFLEVETPVLQPLAGGANAESFATHHNALDTDLYLRIAPELYLKRLIIGGFPKVYEIGRCFRNEGIDLTHNPEFSMLEFYESFADSAKHRELVQELLRSVVKEVCGGLEIACGEDKIDFSQPFTVISYYDLLKQYALIANPETISLDEAVLKAKQFGVVVDSAWNLTKVLDHIYKKVCRPKLVQPTYIIDYPASFFPLAKRKADNENLLDAFQLVAGGIEIAKAFSELNDPIDQRERFAEQEKDKAAGDKEAQETDEDFLEALEHGMPPCAGVGIGIERLVMFLTNTKSIREVVFFPTLRPK